MSKIEWTNATWNPVRGCSRVSPGCEHCYAERMARRLDGPGRPYEGLTVMGKKGPRWNGTIRLVPEKLEEPLHWRKPRRVFVNSMSDLFHEGIPDEYIAAVFGVMAACPQHTFQVLTKRPERMLRWFEWIGRDLVRQRLYEFGRQAVGSVINTMATKLDREWPLPNVWLGVSCEDQQRSDERIPLLFECPAAVRFLSLEPLLEPIRLRGVIDFGIDWVIVGGESGPGARPCDVQSVTSIVHQCRQAGVACFVKQLGSRSFDSSINCLVQVQENKARLVRDNLLRLKDRKGGDPSEWPPHLRVREFPT